MVARVLKVVLTSYYVVVILGFFSSFFKMLLCGFWGVLGGYQAYVLVSVFSFLQCSCNCALGSC